MGDVERGDGGLDQEDRTVADFFSVFKIFILSKQIMKWIN